MTGLATIALLSNPHATGNLALLPAMRAVVAAHPNIYHYEIDDVAQVPEALRQIARIKPDILALNGGDSTVQSVLTELHHDNWFAGAVPPVAVLPNGTTNLIAHNLGASDDAIAALRRLVTIARGDVESHVVPHALIRLSSEGGMAPAFGLVLGGGGLADIILFCRKRIYPLGLPNRVSHGLAAIVLLAASLVSRRARRLTVSVRRAGRLQGSFAAVLVTTLDRLLFDVRARDASANGDGSLRLLAVERRRSTILRTAWAILQGTLGQRRFEGFHLSDSDEIRIEGSEACVVLDGETYRAPCGGSLLLRSTRPLAFVNLAAA